MGVNKRANIAAAKRRGEVEKTFRFGIIVAVGIAILGYLMVFFLGRYGQVHTLHVDPAGAELLKTAFFSGEPWLVQCVSDEVPLHAAALAAARNLASSTVNVGSLRCLDPLPSGKNFFQRFGFRDDSLPDKDHPLFFLFANQDPPKRPKGADLRNTTTIVDFAARESVPRVHALKSEKDLGYHCIKRKSCLLLVAGGQVDVEEYKWVAEAHRNTRILTVNTNDFSLSFLEAAGIADQKSISVAEPKIVVLRSTLSEEDAKKIREQQAKDKANRDAAKKNKGKAPPAAPLSPSPYGVYVHGSPATAKAVNSLVSSHVTGGDAKGEGWVAVTDPKAASLRIPETAAERARRQRREEARRAHNARKHGRSEEEVTTASTTTDEDGTTTTTVEEDEDAASSLDLEDDDIVVTDDEE